MASCIRLFTHIKAPEATRTPNRVHYFYDWWCAVSDLSVGQDLRSKVAVRLHRIRNGPHMQLQMHHSAKCLALHSACALNISLDVNYQS